MSKLFILEGVDGVGKSTAMANTSALLWGAGIAHQTVAFPLKTPGTLSSDVRKILLGDALISDPHVEFSLYMAANLDTLTTVIIPALERGEVVLCDRYFTTTYVQQIFARMELGLGRGAARRYLFDILEQYTRKHPVLVDPHVFILTASKEDSIKRTIGRSSTGEFDHYDKAIESNFDKFHEGYRKLIEQRFITSQYVSVDASRAPDQVASDVFTHIRDLLLYPVV